MQLLFAAYVDDSDDGNSQRQAAAAIITNANSTCNSNSTDKSHDALNSAGIVVTGCGVDNISDSVTTMHSPMSQLSCAGQISCLLSSLSSTSLYSLSVPLALPK